jgi:ABC-type lipoprotein release transport system permease subunit
MAGLIEVARTGVTAILLHPFRSLVSLVCLLVLLVPYLAGMAISQGIGRDAQASIRYGADLYVTGEELGRRAPVPLALLPAVRNIPGVGSVVPRIVGAVTLGRDREPAVVVGLSGRPVEPGIELVEGRLYDDHAPNELVVGTELARRLHLRPGSRVPPFYRNDGGEKVSTVVGVFRADVSLWQSRLILASFETAAAIFDQEGVAGDLLVYCRPGYVAAVRQAIGQAIRTATPRQKIQCRITTRDELEALVPAGLRHQAGIFQLHFLLAFAAGVLVIMVTSGIGLPDRRREIGILKATGWQTDEILLQGAVESLLLSATAAGTAVLLAFGWLKLLNGYGLASLFLSGVDRSPSFEVPYLLAPLPALLGFLFSWIVVTSGTLYSAWRTATVSPREAMR